jgi:hypothetical protein
MQNWASAKRMEEGKEANIAGADAIERNLVLMGEQVQP